MRRLFIIAIILFSTPSFALYKGIAGKVPVLAWDMVNAAYKTGDAANITAMISKDGAAWAALTDANPVEIGNGLYVFDISEAEANADCIIISATSDTANILLAPVAIYTMTTERGTDSAITSLSGIATSTNISDLQTHGDSTWSTADVSGLATEATQYLIYQEVSGLDGEAMRGTDSALLTSASDEIPWNAAWDAETQSEVTDALNAFDFSGIEVTASAISATTEQQIDDIESAVNDIKTVVQTGGE